MQRSDKAFMIPEEPIKERQSTMTKLTHGLADFTLGLFVFFGLAAVPLLLALGEGQFALGDSVAEIDPQGNERKTFVVQLPLQFDDLFLAQQQLSRPEGAMVEWTARQIFTDVDVYE